ncbi:MAG: hypothetical protein ABRQ26_15370 [Syntrophomonadaceae bacterium]
MGKKLVAAGYIYQKNTETIPVGANLKFSDNGRLEGISHTPGTAVIEVGNEGVYGITFSIYTTNVYQDWAVDVNGVEQARFSYGGPVMSDYAQLDLKAHDKITIRNAGTEPDPAELVSGNWVTAYMLIYGYK